MLVFVFLFLGICERDEIENIGTYYYGFCVGGYGWLPAERRKNRETKTDRRKKPFKRRFQKKPDAAVQVCFEQGG